MPLLASILAVCLVAGAMLSVATFSPATGHEHQGHPSATATRSAQNSSSAASTTATSATASPSAGAREDRPAFGLGELLGPVHPAGERDQAPATRGPVRPGQTPRHRPAA